MASKNAQAALAVYENFNKRDLDGAVSGFSDDLVFQDHGLGHTYKSRAEFRDSLQSWIDGFSNAEVTEPRAIDAGDTVVIQFVGKGTNDGKMGAYQPSGRELNLPFVDVLTFDEQGRIASGETYFDLLSLLVQLGHMERPAQPAAARS